MKLYILSLHVSKLCSNFLKFPKMEASDTMNMSLFLGEGNFSFSSSLALSPDFLSLHTGLIATDFVPELKDFLEKGKSNIDSIHQIGKKTSDSDFALLQENVTTLKSLGHTVLFDVDATKIHENIEIKRQLAISGLSKLFVIFNFPHVKSKKMKIGLNRDLLMNFFISCDKLFHDLNKHDGSCSVDVIPIVSLCAGQSGIPEVERVPRDWGDTWQINDMAAHGNFVCVEICSFYDWNFYKITQPVSHDTSEDGASKRSKLHTYQSCYYRLQSGTSFTTENALTLTYQHREHIDPERTRLNSISLSTIDDDILQIFSPILEEKVLGICQDLEECKNLTAHQRLYHHVIIVLASDSTQKISAYLKKNEDELFEVKVVDCQICVRKPGGEVVNVGVLNEDNTSTTLFIDTIVELKYNCDYRHIMVNNAFTPSLYPRTHKFHISFWLSPKFSLDLFLETLLNVYGLMMKSVMLEEIYVNEHGRKSVCWSIQVESLELPLSRLCAHQIYLRLRKELNERLEVEVR